MNFSKFINKTWNINFCRNLALEAKHNILRIINEMTMGGGEAPRMPVLYDKEDYQFLQQFPTQIWANALKWRYNDGLREMLVGIHDPNHIPDGWDWVDEIRLPDPSRPKSKKWVFGQKDGEDNIWIGLTQLAHKLTDPPKESRFAKGKGKAYWAGDGPSIGEIDPHEIDPKSSKHVNAYKHGIYNFDLSHGVNISEEDIDNMTDYQIMSILPEDLQEMVPGGVEPGSIPKIRAAIDQKKERMKKVMKHSFAGYDVLQSNVAAESIGNWVRANGLNLFGDHPTEYIDKLTKTTHKIEKTLTDPKEIQDQVHGRWGEGESKTPMHVGVNKLPIKVPVIKKDFNFKVINDKGEILDKPHIREYIPVLNPVKALPQVQLSQEQKEALEKARGERNVESPGDLQGLLNIWDFLTPVQQEYIKKNGKTPFQVGQAKWNKDKGEGTAKYDANADPDHIYTTGHKPNHKAPERGSFNLPPEKIDDFIKKYKEKIFSQILGSTGKYGGKLDQILHWMKESGKYPVEVIKALEDRSADVAEYATYMVMGWLDDPRFGIKDTEIGLLEDYPDSAIDEESNKLRRDQMVYNLVSSIAQIPLTSGLLSRKRREKYGVASTSSIDAPAGDSGESGAGNFEGGKKQGGNKRIDTSAKRAWFDSDKGSITRATLKTHKMYEKVSTFLAAKRNYILHRLHGSSQVANDLKIAANNISLAATIAQELFVKYDDELSKQYPDPDIREQQVYKLINAELHGAVAKAGGNLSEKEKEEVLAKVKHFSTNDAILVHSPELLEKAKKAFSKFYNNLIETGKGRIPLWNPAPTGDEEDFEEGKLYTFQNFPKDDPQFLIDYLKYLNHSFPELISNTLKEWGPTIYVANQMAWNDDDEDEEVDENELKKPYYAALASEQTLQKTAAPSPQQVPQAAPQQVPQAAPMNLAAKSIGELLALAPNFKSKAEMGEIINGIISKRNEFLTNKEEAVKLDGILGSIIKHSNDIGLSDPLGNEDRQLLKKLQNLVGEINAAHDIV